MYHYIINPDNPKLTKKWNQIQIRDCPDFFR